MLCSPRVRFSSSSRRRGVLMTPALPARTSSRISAITTLGRGCRLNRERRISFWYTPFWAWKVVSTDGVAEPRTRMAFCWAQRNFAASRAW